MINALDLIEDGNLTMDECIEVLKTSLSIGYLKSGKAYTNRDYAILKAIECMEEKKEDE